MCKTDRCYLGEIGYFLQCKDCTQHDSNKMCYSSKIDVELHLEDFQRLFELDSGELEEMFVHE